MRILLASISFLLMHHISHAQPGTEIYLFKLTTEDGTFVLSEPVNISNQKGYDNQPFFHPTKPIIYFASSTAGNVDIKYYDYATQKLSQFTNTPVNEFSPTVTPDGKFISTIIQRENGAQDLGKYPISGGDPVVLINNLTVGYHAWIDSQKLLLFILKDSATREMHYYNLATKEDKLIAQKPGHSLHKIPGEEAMSFIEKTTAEEYSLKRFDIQTGEITTITTLPGTENVTWTKDGLLLVSKEKQVMVYNKKTAKWQFVTIKTGDVSLKNISRLAISPDNNYLALVISE